MRTNAYREEAIADHKMEKYIERLLEELQTRFDHLHK